MAEVTVDLWLPPQQQNIALWPVYDQCQIHFNSNTYTVIWLGKIQIPQKRNKHDAHSAAKRHVGAVTDCL